MTRLHDAALEREFTDRLARHRRTLLAEEGIVQGSLNSQVAIARRLGVSPATLCQWECQTKFPPSFAMWILWARAVGMTFKVELE